MPTLREVGEFEAIRRLIGARGAARGSEADHASIVVGPGDDAAVLRPRPGFDLVATTDSFVEHRHFSPDWFSPREVGSRLAAACTSDLAAMGASPRWVLHSLAVRPDHELESLIEIQRGVEEFLAGEGATIVGGNIVAVEGPESMSLTVLGEVAQGRAWTRSGASAGDLIAVTGSPGRAAAGFLLARTLRESARRPEWKPLLDAWIRPCSRGGIARLLGEGRAVRAAIDISDGFAADLFHLCEASGVGAELDDQALLGDSMLERAAREMGTEVERLVFGASDDYELLLAIDPAQRSAGEEAARSAGVPLIFVGRLEAGKPALVRKAPDGSRRPLVPTGWDHFAKARGN